MERSPGEAYARIVRRRLIGLVVLALGVAASVCVDLATGPSVFPLGDVVRGLFDPAALSDSQRVILWHIRLPQALLALLVGLALGLAGAEAQTALNNSLASPCTLGLTAAATVGASVAIVFQWHVGGPGQQAAIPVAAFASALGASLLVQALARVFGSGVEMLVLFGIALVFLGNALVALLQFIASSGALEQVVFWTMGSVARASWGKIAVLAVAFGLVAPFAWSNAWRLSALRAGEEQAAGLGVAVGRLRLRALLRISLLAALAVAFAGAIGFVGLVGPHLARMAFGEDHRFYLPGAALAGALVLSLSSILAKSLVPGLVLPIGIVTALAGIPLLVALLVLQRKRR
jgi:iron complex transport system permease protein